MNMYIKPKKVSWHPKVKTPTPCIQCQKCKFRNVTPKTRGVYVCMGPCAKIICAHCVYSESGGNIQCYECCVSTENSSTDPFPYRPTPIILKYIWKMANSIHCTNTTWTVMFKFNITKRCSPGIEPGSSNPDLTINKHFKGFFLALAGNRTRYRGVHFLNINLPYRWLWSIRGNFFLFDILFFYILFTFGFSTNLWTSSWSYIRCVG